jgi:5-methylcytosine-specific restriction endonuclease McrBC regulatory subunit McrC
MTATLEGQILDDSESVLKPIEWCPSFKCSIYGKESALCVLQVVVEEGDKLPLIAIHVVPKFWATSSNSLSVLRIDVSLKDPIVVTVPETGRLVIQGKYARQVAAVIKKSFDSSVDPELDDSIEEDGNQADSRKALFVPMPDVSASEISHSPDSDSGHQMQALLSLAVSASNKIDDILIKAPGSKSDGGIDDLLHYLSRNPILMKQDAIANLVKQLFVSVTLEALKRRKPDFRQQVDRLNVVRGSLILSDIPRRRAQRTQLIECEFDELDLGSEWFALIRCAARTISRDPGVSPTSRDGAVAIDRALTDAPLMSVRNALKVSRNLRMNRKQKHWVRSVDFAKSVLQNTQPLGGERSTDSRERGFAAHVYIPTSELFERMLVESTRSAQNDSDAGTWELTHYDPGEEIESDSGSLPTFKLREKQQKLKLPDMFSTDRQYPDAWFLVDAKYKERPQDLNGMSMGDQYQQFAYALIANTPTLFLYAQSGEVASEPDIDFTTLNRIKVGLAAVSFPKPGEDQGTLLNRSWKTSMNRQIQKLLNEFTAKT